MKRDRTNLTPPELAKQWGVDPQKIRVWIEAGELHAFNVATRLGSKPRWLITPEAIADFERRRSAVLTPPSKPERKPFNKPKKQYF